MKILKSYYKTPSFLTGRCIVSLAILGLISCSDRNGKSLSEATNDPAGIYREYLYNIRRQKDSSFQVLTKHILQWQTVKDSVFRYLRNDTLSHPHSNQREECIRLHDSIRTEFSRLALSKTRTYQELLALKGEFSPYNNDEELHHAAGEIRPFFNSLDNLPLHKGNKEEILAAYRMLLTRTIRNGIHSRNELLLISLKKMLYSVRSSLTCTISKVRVWLTSHVVLNSVVRRYSLPLRERRLPIGRLCFI